VVAENPTFSTYERNWCESSGSSRRLDSKRFANYWARTDDSSGSPKRLIAMLHATAGHEDIALSTNGVKLPEIARTLRDAGLERVNIFRGLPAA